MTQGKFQPVRRIYARQTAPEGGASARLRMLARGCLLGWACAAPAFADDLAVPSGQSLSLMEIRSDVMGAETWLRFRFLAPAIARDTGAVDFQTAEADMAHLCATVAVPHVAQTGTSAERVVISLSDRPVDFGVSDAEATQFFDAFRIENDRCIWEGL